MKPLTESEIRQCRYWSALVRSAMQLGLVDKFCRSRVFVDWSMSETGWRVVRALGASDPALLKALSEVRAAFPVSKKW
jgi:hypothetical protein